MLLSKVNKVKNLREEFMIMKIQLSTCLDLVFEITAVVEQFICKDNFFRLYSRNDYIVFFKVFLDYNIVAPSGFGCRGGDG